MGQSHLSACLFAALIAIAAPLLPIAPANAAQDYALNNGHFYTQTADRPSSGFAVRDEGVDDAGHLIRFWNEFRRYGGVSTLGYPISRVYREDDGFYYQLFQRALLQWHPESGSAALANIFDQMSADGADPWLAAQGIPQPSADPGEARGFEASVAIRLSWLTQPQIKAQWLAASPSGDPREAMSRYGLPVSAPLRTGPFIVQRFQRVALQLWVDWVPGMPAPGSVVPVLAGELFRKHAHSRGIGAADQRFLTQDQSSIGLARSTTSRAAFVDDGLRQPVALLADSPAGPAVTKAILSPGVRLVFADVSAIALFTPSTLTIAIHPQLRYTDPKALAAVLAHEGSHLSDYLNGVNMLGREGCLRTELVAFQTQAKVWQGFYGPYGKAQPTSSIDLELNKIVADLSDRPEGFTASLAATYKEECGS